MLPGLVAAAALADVARARRCSAGVPRTRWDSIPLAAAGGLFGLVGVIAQDVQTIKLANSYAYVASDKSGGASAVQLNAIRVGSSGSYQSSKKESYSFVVIEIKEETSDDKIIRIEYTDDSGEKEQKLIKASNSKLSFTNY